MSSYCHFPFTRQIAPAFFLICALSVLICVEAVAQQSNFTKEMGRDVLKFLKEDIKKKYYDPACGGHDLDGIFKSAEEKMNNAQSTGQIMGIIAQAAMDLDDSHTFFIPPSRANRTEYGIRWQVFGDQCFVAAVKPGSDAEKKEVLVGDRIIAINGFEITRENAWKARYLFFSLRPQPGLRLTLQSPRGVRRDVDILARVRQGKQIMNLTSGIDYYEYLREMEKSDYLDRPRYQEYGEELLILKLPGFDFDPDAVRHRLGKAHKFKNMILDLRGNPGGYVKTCEEMVSFFFDREVKIADLKGRKEMKPSVAKKHNNPFTGRLIVLLDSDSGSASEVFSRVIQLEKRGTVLGDRSAGAVMQSMSYPHYFGTDTIIPYAFSITNADLIMADGKSLEKVGVIPDERILPTQADLAAGRDPVLSRAAELCGVKLNPVDAGKLFPIEWREK